MGLFDLRPKKVSNVRQSYWKAKKVPIFKQRNDDDRLGKNESKIKAIKEESRQAAAKSLGLKTYEGDSGLYDEDSGMYIDL